MPEYTVQVEMEDVHGDWQVASRSNLTDERDPSILVDWLVDKHFIADGADWQVRVWLGHDANPDTKPAAWVGWNEYEP